MSYVLGLNRSSKGTLAPSKYPWVGHMDYERGVPGLLNREREQIKVRDGSAAILLIAARPLIGHGPGNKGEPCLICTNIPVPLRGTSFLVVRGAGHFGAQSLLALPLLNQSCIPSDTFGWIIALVWRGSER